MSDHPPGPWTVEQIWRYYLDQAIRRKAACEADIKRLSEQLGEPAGKTFDVGVIQLAIIDQLHQTAASNNCKILECKHGGGWYRYRGIIDTWYLAEAVIKAIGEPAGESTDAAMGSGKAMK